MKILNHILAVTLIISCCTSCKKINTDVENNNPPLKIKTYTEEITSATMGHTNETFNLLYDSDNRLTSLQSVSASGSKFIYEYISPTSFTMDLYKANALILHQTFFINGISLVDSTFQYNDTGDTSTDKSLYNSAKQLVKKFEYDVIGGSPDLYNTTDYTYDNKGNLVTESDSYSTTSYSYDTVILNTANISPIYFPVPNQLPTKTVYSAGADSYTIDHTYTFDADTRLTSDKAVYSNGDIVIKSYTYY